MIEKDLSSLKKEYISLQEATQFCKYSQEYLSLRARQGKLKAVKMGRNWVTTKDWLEEYLRKVEEYNHKIKKISQPSKTVGRAEPPENLPVGEPQKIKIPFWKAVRAELSFHNLRSAFLMGLVLALVIASGVWGREDLRKVYSEISPYLVEIIEKAGAQTFSLGREEITLAAVGESILNIFKDYSDWITKEIRESLIGRQYVKANKVLEENLARAFQNLKGGYSSANQFIEGKISALSRMLVKSYLTANDFIEKKISQGWQSVKKLTEKMRRLALLFMGREEEKKIGLTKEELKKELMEVEKAEREKLMEDIRVEFQKLKKEGIPLTKEIVTVTQKEVITRKAEIEERVVTIEEEDLEKFKERMDYLEEEISKRLYAPGGIIQQTIRVTEPVRSPKIYEENGEIILQTLGSGNVILSAATGLQLYGQQVVIDSSSTLNPMIYLADNTKIDGTLTAGDADVGTLTAGATTISGDLTVSGDTTISGDLTVSGAQNYSGASAITASSTDPALQVTQNGTGNIVQFIDGGTNVFTITDGGYTTLAVSPSVVNPAFLFRDSDTTNWSTGTATYLGINATSSFSGNLLDLQKSGVSLFYIDANGNATTSGTIYAESIFTTGDDATVRESGEEIVRGVVPIFGFDLPVRCKTACNAGTYATISRVIENNDDIFPNAYPGTTRKYRFSIRYADATTTPATRTIWQVATSSDPTYVSQFTLPPTSSTDLSKGFATTTNQVSLPANDDWFLRVTTGGSGNYELQIYEILLIGVDEVN